jgi:protein-L-isoaspartate(D-aspartate) O-methyltransferase
MNTGDINTAARFEAERQVMVEKQLRPRGIHDERVLEAMASVPRHEFLPEAQMHLSYADRALPIGAWETISQPYIVAVMTQAADVHPGDRVLEIGTGAGYQAAVLAHLGAEVHTIERNPELAEEAAERLERLGYDDVEVVTGDGSRGYPACAPYDAILVTAASPRAPQALVDQLAEGGRLVIPVGDRHEQQLELIVKADGEIRRRALDSCQFVPLLGKEGWSEAGQARIL